MRLILCYGIALFLSMSSLSALIEVKSHVEAEELKRCGHYCHHRLPQPLSPPTIVDQFSTPNPDLVPIISETLTGVEFAIGDSNQEGFAPVNPTSSITILSTRNYTGTFLFQLQNNSSDIQELTFLLKDKSNQSTLLTFSPIAIQPDGIIYNVFLKFTGGIREGVELELVPPAIADVNINGLLFGVYTNL